MGVNKANWAGTTAAKADCDPFTPFASGYNDTAVTNTYDPGTANTATLSLADSFAWEATIATTLRATPISISITTGTDAKAESGSAESDAAINVRAGCSGGC